MPVTIKRYQNRKLYNTQSKRYITLEGIEDLLKNGQEIIVIDNSTGKDITAITLSQIIFEFEKNRSGFLPIKLLVSLVQSGGNRIDDLRRNITDSLGLYHLYDVEIERRLKLLIERGELTQDAATQLLKKLISINHQAYDSKGNIEEVIFGYLKDRQIPTKKDLEVLIQKIDTLSQNLDELQAGKEENE
jgi:polyhydroxyalkanoate synthesis repressor PhaR